MRTWSSYALLVCAVITGAGCGPDGRVVARSDLVAGQADAARKTINSNYDHHLATDPGETSADTSASRHLLLWHLERGSVDHVSDLADAALGHWQDASRLARDARTRSAARAVGAAITNDNMTRWSGEVAEIVRIPYFGLLDHWLALQQSDGTLPGAIDSDQAAIHADRAASAASALVDQLDRAADGEYGDTHYKDDPWLVTIAAATRWAMNGTNDDRAIAKQWAERAQKSYHQHGLTPAVADTLLARIQGTQACPDGQGSVLVIEESGWVGLRQELQIYIVTAAPADSASIDLGGVFVYVDGPGKEHLDPLHGMILPGWLIRNLTGGQLGVFGCEIPVMPALGARPGFGQVATAAGMKSIEPVDDIGADVLACFTEGQKGRVAKILIRTASKLIAARVGSQAVRNSGNGSASNEAMAQAVWFVSSLLVTASEQADTRCWSQLPGRVGASLIDLPAGTHSIAVTGSDGVVHNIAPMQVRAGQLAVVVVRSYPNGNGIPERKR